MSRNLTSLKFDDTIHCRFFCLSQSSEKDLEQFCDSINEAILSLSQGYIWNRDVFRVNNPLHQDENDDSLPYLDSVTCFGDNIEDEWFIVFLIFELTKIFNDLIVYAEDNDGSFLLIEAADSLPGWLNPDIADNRVFIYQNSLHIVTPELVNLDSMLQLCDSVKLVSINQETTIASTEIQEAIRKKICGYPQKIKDCMHMAVVDLPIDVAAILKIKPSVISHIVNTYCNIDAFDVKTCREVDYTNCIQTQIEFTKCLYAMLMHSKPVKDIRHNIPEKDKKAQLGFKLTCGYHIIMNQYAQDTFASPEYKKYITSLTKTGYFKNNIEGSKEYQHLLEKAKSYFLNMECPMNTHIYNEISCLKSDKSFEEMKEHLLHNDNSEINEYDDEWLNISSDQLNNILNSQYGNKTKMNNEHLDTPKNIASALTEFMKKTSDFEGIERVEENIDENQIDFDADQFATCIEKFLNIATSNEDIDLSDESGDSEYDDSKDEISQEMEQELSSKLCSVTKNTDNKTVLNYFVQSMKGEGLSGPSSNVLKTIGINKTDLLDSDDDE